MLALAMRFTVQACRIGLTLTSIQPKIQQITHSYESYHSFRNTFAQLCHRVSNPVLCDTVYKHMLLLHLQIVMDHREVGVTLAACKLADTHQCARHTQHDTTALRRRLRPLASWSGRSNRLAH